MEVTKKKFYFLRHGRTDWNDRSLCQGQTNVPLNAAGKEEVERVFPVLPKLTFSKIVTSPLARALETAQIIQNHTRLPMDVLADIQERFWGGMEGATSAEMYRVEEQEEADINFYPGFNIESRSQFKARILSGINASLERDTPLFVSHGRVFLVLLELLGLPPIRQIPNATIIECIPSSQTWKINLHSNN